MTVEKKRGREQKGEGEKEEGRPGGKEKRREKRGKWEGEGQRPL